MSHAPACDHVFSNWEPVPNELWLWRYCLVPGCHHEEYEYENWAPKEEAA